MDRGEVSLSVSAMIIGIDTGAEDEEEAQESFSEFRSGPGYMNLIVA